MVWEVLVQGLLSAFAGIVAAGFAAWISSYRERLTWVENEVYQPLYNEIHEAAQGDLPDKYNTKWDEFSYYKKSRVNDNFRNRMSSYSNNVQKLSEIEKDADYRYEWLADELPDEMIERDGEERQLKAFSFEHKRDFYRDMDKWYKRHLPEFDRWESNKDNYSMGKELKEISKKRNWNYEQLYRYWQHNHNIDIDYEWGKQLYNAYTFGCMRETEHNIGYTGYVRRQIQDQAREIETHISDRVEESIFDMLVNKVLRWAWSPLSRVNLKQPLTLLEPDSSGHDHREHHHSDDCADDTDGNR